MLDQYLLVHRKDAMYLIHFMFELCACVRVSMLWVLARGGRAPKSFKVPLKATSILLLIIIVIRHTYRDANVEVRRIAL